MLGIAAVSVLALVVLLVTEKAARDKKLSTELSRKIPHTVLAIAIATWPFFVSMHTVLTLGLVFTFVAMSVRFLNLFPHSRAVDRKSWGEVLFGLGITLCALIGPDKWVFAAAMLYLGIADAAAALVGKRRGKRSYQFFGHIKTVEGSLAFVVAAVVITALVVLAVPAGLEGVWTVIIWLPLVAAAVEAIAPRGLDNIFVPVLVAVILTSLQAS